MKRHFLAACFYCLSALVNGQDNSFLGWTDFNYQNYTSPKFSYGGDAGIRGLLTSNDWTAAYIRPKVQYDLKSYLIFSATVAGFQNWNVQSPNAFEFRPAQEVLAIWPQFKIGRFNHRFRLEQRYFVYEDTVDETVEDESGWYNRFRYELSFRSDYFNVSEKINNIFLHSSLELFAPIGSDAPETFFNQNRLIFGFGHLLRKGWSYKVDFMLQQSRNTVEGDFETTDFILRFRIYLKQRSNV